MVSSNYTKKLLVTGLSRYPEFDDINIAPFYKKQKAWKKCKREYVDDKYKEVFYKRVKDTYKMF